MHPKPVITQNWVFREVSGKLRRFGLPFIVVGDSVDRVREVLAWEAKSYDFEPVFVTKPLTEIS